MKRWIAYVLVLCLCLTPVLCCAQTVTTEELLSQILLNLARQAEHPSFGFTMSEGENAMDFCFALDQEGMPDVSLGVQSGDDAVRIDADAAGLRYDDGQQRIAVTYETLLRALCSSPNGVCLMPDITEADMQMFAQIVQQIGVAASSAVTMEMFPAPAQQAAEQAQGQQESVRQTQIDIKQMIMQLSEAVPAAIGAHEKELQEFLMRNFVPIRELTGIRSVPQVSSFLEVWPAVSAAAAEIVAGSLTATITEGQGWCDICVKAGGREMLIIHVTPGRMQAQSLLPGYRLEFDTNDLKSLAGMAVQALSGVSKEALNCQFVRTEDKITANLKLDAERAVDDLVISLTDVVRRNRAEIERLTERYEQWVYAFDMDIPMLLYKWERVMQRLTADREEIGEDLMLELDRLLYDLGLGWDATQEYFPLELHVELPYLKREIGGFLRFFATGRIDLSMPKLDWELTFNDSSFSSSLRHANSIGRLQRIEHTGWINEKEAHLHGERYNAGMLMSSWHADAIQSDDGWNVCLYDGENQKTAELNVNENGAVLQAGELTAEVIGTDSGMLLHGRYGIRSFGAQVYDGKNGSYAMVNTGKRYITLSSRADNGTQIFEIDVSDLTRNAEYALSAKLAKEGLTLHAGMAARGQKLLNLDTDVRMEGGMLQLCAALDTKMLDGKIEYRPGMLSVGWARENLGETMQLNVMDITKPGDAGNETRLTMQTKGKLGEHSYTREKKWDVKTEAGEKRYTAVLESYGERPLTLTLDFAAEPKMQDLSGYTWLTRNEAFDMVRELTATPTPAPTATPAPETAQN